MEENRLRLDQKVRVTPEEVVPGWKGNTDLWRKPVEPTVGELLKLSVVRSDNTSSDKLLQLVGGRLSWIDLPIFEVNGEPRQKSGLVDGEPGLYFVGQHFQHSVSSTMIHGVGRDAARIVRAIGSRSTRRAVVADSSSRSLQKSHAQVA